MADNPTYVAVAYRYGAMNSHQYFVHCGDDLAAAKRSADFEHSERVGKYGIAVWEFNGDVENAEQKMVHYAASKWAGNQSRSCRPKSKFAKI